KVTKDSAKLFYIWGHTYEFEGDDNWNVIEEFAEFMGGRDDIWYATNIEIFEYIKDFESLVYSVDGSIVTNPTARTLYYFYNGEIGSIAPGETKRV
ncbi:MAG: polysaccharide deacetylase, partial [Clostridia bacterium]|nr:polysaccharide deacetylase [Clostridia bacterium]